MQYRRWERYLGGVLLLLGMLAGVPAHGDAPPPIAITPQDGFNLEVVDQINPHYVIVKLASPAHNWFAGTFTNLPTDKEVTIGLSMTGNDTKGNAADVKKWEGLVPVMTYADPTQYEAYEWFQKDAQGRWVSDDPFKKGEARYAGTSRIPAQTVISNEVAEQFLSANGQEWSAWREVDEANAIPTLNIFRVTMRFAYPTATVAMRVPYTYTYLQAFITRLRERNRADVQIHQIGMTPGKRSLQAIFFPALYPREPISQQQTVLVIAREHATEPDSSWVAQGVIRTLLNTTPEVQGIRTQTNWIIIPIEDPDGSADAIFDRLTEAFKKTNDPPVPSEVLDYTRYFADYIAGGRTIDVAVSLHSVEANECPHLFCPFVDFGIPTQVTTINTHFFSAAQAAGFQTGAPGESWAYGIMSFRLYGWCANHYRTLDLAYEINSRYPAHRLSLSQTHRLGNLLVNTLTWWVSGDAGKDWHRKTWQIVEALRIRRQAYFKTLNRSPETRTPHELVNLGY